MAVGYAQCVDEHFVEVCATAHLAQRANLDRRVMHIGDEHRESAMGDRIVPGTSQEQADVAVMASRRPHFLAGDDPFAAVTYRTGGHRR